MNYALTHVTVIDATGAAPKPGQTILIRDGRITAIGAGVPIPEDADVVDLTGKHVIPGLADMHVHLEDMPGDVLKLYLAAGVTTVREMAGLPFHHEWRRKIGSGLMQGPRMTIGSKIIDGSPTLWTQMPAPFWVEVADAGQARAQVRLAAKEGADFIKVYSRLSRESYFAIADEAGKAGLPYAGHIPDAVPIAEAVAAGQRSFEHVHALFAALSRNDAALLQAQADLKTEGPDHYTSWLREIYETDWLGANTVDPYKADRVFQSLIGDDAYFTPTLVVHEAVDQPAIISVRDPDLKYLPRDRPAMWEHITQTMFAGGRQAQEGAERRLLFQRRLEIVKVMDQAGVPLLAGSDTSPLTVPGFGLHREMELMAEAGIPPMRVLQAATRNAARFLGTLGDLGTVEEGKLADLVVLDGDPLADIGNVRRVHSVVLGGRMITPDDRRRMLEEVERAAG
ncbi:amidohydrolase family protein [Nonomuraea typhae]|uniref:amidohydrolase family protein n=1 Tax=Nonomuraea typhae TaxID=2603600 RepID=UPI0012FA7FF3|nr:amidohydrolase family protein [Nonomuraea typhae]